MNAAGQPWWEQRRYLVLLALSLAIPLVWPTTPPLTDLPGHMGRYAVQLGLADDPVLGQWYEFKWRLLGNLGVDLLVQLFAPLFGLEPTVKGIVMAIPVMQAAGMLLVAREIHGRVPSTALFALPLAYAYPFQFGFVNYSLSVGMALMMFALWLRLTKMKKWRMRVAVFVPASFLLWLTHTYGWGLLGLMVGGSELVRQRQSDAGWGRSIALAAAAGLMLAGPAILVLMAGSNAPGAHTGYWFEWAIKLKYLTMVFRDRWEWFDIVSFAVIGIVLIRAALRPQFRLNRELGIIAALLALVFVLLPRVLLYSAYADMRLAPMMLAFAILAIGPLVDRKAASMLALVGLAFMGVRLGGLTASAALYDQDWTRTTAAIDMIPQHARILALVGVGKGCTTQWFVHRKEHVPALALVRRHAFVNDQWAISTAQLLRVTKSDAPGFVEDISQMVVAKGCLHPEWAQVQDSLKRFPRPAFDYVWLIDPPKFDPSLLNGLDRVWTNGQDSLYRINISKSGKSE